MGKQRSITWFLWAILGLVLYGCTSNTMVGPAPSPSLVPDQLNRTPIGASPQAIEAVTRERPTFTPGPVGAPTLTPTPTPHPELRVELLPRPLYFLGPSQEQLHLIQLWRLDPSATVVRPVTPAEAGISAVAIWPEDGRLAYGTTGGQIYAVWPGEQPRLLIDIGLLAGGDEPANKPAITGLSWAPDGERLAYSVRSGGGWQARDDNTVSEVDGLWLLTLGDGTQIKLVENRYLNPETRDVLDFRVVQPVAWAPDGEALLVRMGYWEWSDMVWLEPLVPTTDNRNLKDPEGMWVDASWSADGRSVWLSGLNGSVVSDLARAGRDQAEVKILLNGEVEQKAFFEAQELPAGLAFLAYEGYSQEARLYLGQETAAGFDYKVAGPAGPLCNQGPIWNIVWDPTGQWAAVRCGSEVKLISLEGSAEENLTPFLEPLAMGERSMIFWVP